MSRGGFPGAHPATLNLRAIVRALHNSNLQLECCLVLKPREGETLDRSLELSIRRARKELQGAERRAVALLADVDLRTAEQSQLFPTE